MSGKLLFLYKKNIYNFYIYLILVVRYVKTVDIFFILYTHLGINLPLRVFENYNFVASRPAKFSTKFLHWFKFT